MPRVCARTKPASATVSSARSQSIPYTRGDPGSVLVQASAMPSSRKRPCAIVIVVFATITEGTLASSGTRPRRSQAFTASPPSAAVGVTRLKASPARRTPRRVRKATPSRRNANCHPSVSNTMTSATGKQSTIASRHESWTIEARIAAGSFVATRTANRATPTTSRTSRRWRRSALPIEEQQDADRGERAGPEPSGHPRLGRGQPELEPAAPADEHPEEAERRVRHLHQELFLEVQAGVRVREKEAAADGAEERKDERRAPGAQATRADHPLEEREGDDQQDEHAVLQYLRVRHALPEPQGPERPRAGVVADQQEAGEPEEDQRPVARPARPAGRVQDREEPHREHEQPRDVVVELGPRAVRGGPRGVAIVDRHLLDRRRRERWPPGREPRTDLGERRAARGHVDRWRQRGQRRRDEEGRGAEPDLDLHEPPQARGPDVRRGRQPAYRQEVHSAQREEPGEDPHLGEDHHAVRRAEQRVDAADVREREREPGDDEDCDGRERERRKALEQERRPRVHAPPERGQDEVAQAADPRRRRDLVQSIERQQEAARPEPRRRVARPRRAHRERQRPPEKRDPSKPGAHRTADAETTDDKPDAGEDAGSGRADIRRGDKLADGPASATHERAELDGEREELRSAKDRRARRGDREAPAERRRQLRARAHRGTQHQQREQDAADGHRLTAQRHTAEQDVNEAGHGASGPASRGADPQEEPEEDRRADGGEDQEHVGPAEGRQNDHQVDEVSMGKGLGQAIGPRGAGARGDVERRPPEDARRRSQPARDRHGPEGERPRRSGGETAPGGDAPEHGDVDEVVAPEIEDRAAARLDELEARQLTVAAVEDRVGQEEKAPDELGAR